MKSENKQFVKYRRKKTTIFLLKYVSSKLSDKNIQSTFAASHGMVYSKRNNFWDNFAG